ncbi:MAG: hypothetical protein R2854_11215 [Caldilineaceae bacterium]
MLTPSLLAVAALFAAAGVTVEAALLQGLMAVAVDAELEARLGLLGGVLTFVIVLLPARSAHYRQGTADGP